MEKTQKTKAPARVLEDGDYTVMNCDTGRKLSFRGKQIFSLKNAAGGYAFRAGGRNLTFAEDGFAETEKSEAFSVVPLKNNRYRIVAPDGAELADDDGGDGADSHSVRARTPGRIECCWYFTKVGEKEPVKLMLIGDSITNGENVDVPKEERQGCRKLLSEKLAEDPARRFVFVGSLKSGNGTAEDAALYRHEGHSGWLAVDIYKRPEFPGLIDHAAGWLAKYTPDVVLCQVGTNDCAFAAGPSVSEEAPYTEQSLAALKERWNRFLDELCTHCDGQFVIATVPPTTRTKCFSDWIDAMNREIPLAVRRWQEKGRTLVFANTNEAIAASTPEKGLSSDRVHLSRKGYAAMAEIYYRKLLELGI